MSRFRKQERPSGLHNGNSDSSNGKAELANAKDVGTGLQRGVRRFTVELPEELYDQVQEAAKKRHTSVKAVIRLGARLAVDASELDDNNPDDAVIIRKGGKETRKVPVW